MQVTFDPLDPVQVEKVMAMMGTLPGPTPFLAPTPAAEEPKPKRKRGPNKKKATPVADPEPTPIEAAAEPEPEPVTLPGPDAQQPPAAEVDESEALEAFKKYASEIGYKNALAFLSENFGVKRMSLVPAEQHAKLMELISAAKS